MDDWKTAMQRGMVSGTTASLLSTAVLGALGKGENRSMFAPTNAISHWLWGDKAALQNRPSLRYTVTGRQLDRKDVPLTIASATASAVACFTDYQLTPRRLHPGYEMRLSTPSLAPPRLRSCTTRGRTRSDRCGHTACSSDTGCCRSGSTPAARNPDSGRTHSRRRAQH